MGLYESLRIDESGVGKQFGNWTQAGPAFMLRTTGSHPRKHCVCQCTCGKFQLVFAGNLTRTTNPTRGCDSCRHGKVAATNTRHGMSRTRVHNIWWGMIVRCTNPKVAAWKDYGGRGIAVCDQWRNSFEAFLADMGQPPEGGTIDRINNDGNYEPGNCRWVPLSKQSDNRRCTRRFMYQGEQLTISQVAVKCGIPAKTIRGRILDGWTFEDAVSRPMQSRYLR